MQSIDARRQALMAARETEHADEPRGPRRRGCTGRPFRALLRLSLRAPSSAARATAAQGLLATIRSTEARKEDGGRAHDRGRIEDHTVAETIKCLQLGAGHGS